MSLPDPLHPALTHLPIVAFPIALILLVLALFVKSKWPLGIGAGCLFLAAVGTSLATWSGEQEEHRAEGMGPVIEAALESHEELAETTLVVAWVTVGLSLASVACLLRWPRLGRGMLVAACLGCLAGTILVWQTGHRGGMLVYDHGVGPRSSEAVNPSDDHHDD